MAEKGPAVETPGETPPADEVEELRRGKEEILTKLKYLQAEFENFRKRTERDAQAFVKFAQEALILRLLPVLDEMDAAIAHLTEPTQGGLRMIRDNLLKALLEAGVQEIPALGQPFDPYLMDAVQQVSDKDSKDGIVKEVVRKGYRLHDRVVRPAQVLVVRNEGEAHG